MKKLYEKSELTFALVWIAVYCVLQSLANPLNEIIGTAYAASAAFCVLQTIVLFVFIRRNGLQKRYKNSVAMIKERKNEKEPSSLLTTSQYDGEDVKAQLLEDQHGKCYICERKMGTDFEIEHFKSKKTILNYDKNGQICLWLADIATERN